MLIATPARAESPPATPPPTLPASVTLAEVLSVAGWDESRLAKFAEGEPLSLDERLEAVRLAERIDRIDAGLLSAAAAEFPLDREFGSNPVRAPRPVRLRGKLIAAKVVPIAESDCKAMEHQSYVEGRVELADGTAVSLLLLDLPQRLAPGPDLAEPVEVVGLVLKRTGGDGAGPVVVAPRIAWYPDTSNPTGVSESWVALAGLGLDVALLEQVRQRAPLTPRESAAFYQLLAAVRGADWNDLAQLATGELAVSQSYWERQVRELGGESPPVAAAKQQQWVLAREVARLAAEGTHSVAPYFNQPEEHVGQVVQLDGTARRALRVELTADDSAAAGIRARGIDHYFELAIFTSDSQNLPVICCVAELPADFPIGPSIREPVRITGFFFKSWQFTSGRALTGEPESTEPQGQIAVPLVIARSPQRLLTASQSGTEWQWIHTTVIVLLLAVAWWMVWRWSAEDRRFARRRKRAEEGQNQIP